MSDAVENPMAMPRIGIGYDIHRWGHDRALVLGGVAVPHTTGLVGHSDADVLTHAIMDALLGALALGNIGTYFPDTDPIYKAISSVTLLDRVMADVKKKGYGIGNVDTTIVCQQPMLNPYIAAMRQCLADHLCCSEGVVSVKATTSEQLGFVGRNEGVCVHAVAIVVPHDNKLG